MHLPLMTAPPWHHMHQSMSKNILQTVHKQELKKHKRRGPHQIIMSTTKRWHIQ